MDEPKLKTKIKATKIFLLTDMDSVNLDTKVLGQLTKLAKTQAPFPIVLAKMGFLDPDLAYEQLLAGTAPNILKAMELGRKQGLFELSEAQYNNAKFGRQKALDNLLLSRGNKVNVKDGYETVNSIDKIQLELLTVDNPDISVDEINKTTAVKLLSSYVKDEIKLSRNQLNSLYAIIKAETLAFNPLTDNIKVDITEGDL